MKPNISRIINKLKAGVKTDKVVSKIKTAPIIKPVLHVNETRVRDMRHDAMDIGAHKAKEYFGEQDGTR